MKRRKPILRIISQVLFFAVFVFLIKTKRPMVWMAIFLASAALAFVFSRFYCGWMCPINTVMQIADWIGKKLKIQKDRVPSGLRSGVVGYAVFALTLVMAYLNFTGRLKLPFLLIMIAAGFLITLAFPEATWHNYLCPYGLILRVPGRFARLGMSVNSSCAGHGICEKVCPAEAVTREDGKAKIDSAYCLVCRRCSARCPEQAVSYGPMPRNKAECSSKLA